MGRYRINGYVIRSDIALPAVAEGDTGSPDIRVRLKNVPKTLEGAVALGPNWAMEGDRFLLEIPQVARFLISGGREIVMELAPGATESDGVAFLMGSAFGILLYQRRHMVLHGSAVRIGEKAVLFCGQSGAGKSTLAASLEAEGFPCINDDLCCISFTKDGEPVVAPDGRSLRLWADSLDALGLNARKGLPVRDTISKFYVETSGPIPKDPVPLGAIYILREQRSSFTGGILKPNSVGGAQLLRRHTYRPWLIEQMGLADDHFRQSVMVQSKTPVFLLTRRFDFGATPGLSAQLQNHWREIGLHPEAA